MAEMVEPTRQKSDAEILTEKRLGASEKAAAEEQTFAEEELPPEYWAAYWRNIAEIRPPDWMPIATLLAGFAAGFAFAVFVMTAEYEKKAGRPFQEMREPMQEYGPGPH